LPPPPTEERVLKFKKRGFTLAEVLITLAIIGIVAALTVPTLMKNYRHAQYKSALKKAYSTIGNAYQKMYYDYSGELPVDSGRLEFYYAFKPYFKVAKEYRANSPWGGLYNENCSYKNLNKACANYRYIDDGIFILEDGTIIFLNTNGNERMVTIDLDGPEKGPNRWGEDFFTFEVLKKNLGTLIPAGSPDSIFKNQNTYCNLSGTNIFNGIGCTYRALYDENYWKELK